MPTPTANTTKPKRTLGQTLAGLLPTAGKSDARSEVLDLRGRLSTRAELKAQLKSIEQEAHHLSHRINQLRSKQRQARDAVDGWQAALNRENPNPVDGKRQSEPKLEAAKIELQGATHRLTRDENKLLALRNRADELREQIAEMSQGATLDEAKEHLEALNRAEAEVERFEALIRDAAASAGPVGDEDEALDALQQAREDLLADIAAGDAQPKELEALDAEIQEILEDSDGSQASAFGQERDTAQTLAGLKRRLSAITRHRDDLRQQTGEVIEQLLIARAEAISEDYVKHAQALQLCYGQLQAVAELLTSAVPGTQVRLLSEQWPNLMIPSLSLKAFRDVAEPDAGRGVLFAGRQARSPDERAKAHAAELSQLDALGVGGLFQR